MSDDTTIELEGPLPDGSLSARLTWRAPRGGIRPGDEDVPRAAATHATLRTTDIGGRTQERRLELGEADAYLRDAAALHARADAQATPSAEREAERTAIAAGIDVRCPHCGVPRQHLGVSHLMSAGRPQHIARETETQLLQPKTRAYEEYMCPRCGSTVWFAAGTVPHPLPGSEPG